MTNNVPENWIAPLSISHQEIAIYRSDELSTLIIKSPLTILTFKGTIEIVKSMSQFEELTAVISRIMFFFTIGAVVFSVLIGWLLSSRLLKPLKAMAQTMQDINQKGMQERMQPISNRDEIYTLMMIFNKMMDQVEESFRQQSRFVEDASHELKTPIAIIEGYLDMLQRWGKEDTAILNESLDASLEEFTRLKKLVYDLLDLSRAEKASLPADAYVSDSVEVISRIVNRFALIYPDFSLEVDLEGISGAEIMISNEHLEQILYIILDNAVKYSLQAKTIFIKAYRMDLKVYIEITDQGVGILAADLPYVMDRFYRVDKSRSREQGGNGIGLAYRQASNGALSRYACY